jgi:hypothetical protein
MEEQLTKKDLKQFISLVFNYINPDKLEMLFRKYRIYGGIAPESIYGAIERNKDFARDFGVIAADVRNDVHFREDLQNRRLLFFSGENLKRNSYATTPDSDGSNDYNSGTAGTSWLDNIFGSSSSSSASDKNAKVESWFNTIVNGLDKVGTLGFGIWDRVTNVESEKVSATNKLAEAELQKANSKNTLMIVGVVAGVIVLITLIAVIVRKK